MDNPFAPIFGLVALIGILAFGWLIIKCVFLLPMPLAILVSIILGMCVLGAIGASGSKT